MKTLHTIERDDARERAVLVSVTVGRQSRADVDEHLEELARLADTAGADVVATLTQERPQIDPALYLGTGKADELAALVKEKEVALVIFDADLSPKQARNLEKLTEAKVIDRTGLILDIFAKHARTREAQTQVELAQLEYLLPRLTGMWTHLSKQHGGIGTKGPGETQLETDRRIIRTRISHLKRKLETIGRQRETQRASRGSIPRVALVGYTNVGKSTLFNELTKAEVLVEDRLFATLDSTTRAIALGGTPILLTDTVGFIRKLPSHLVASFRSTLAEVVEADAIAHVVDCSHPYFEDQMTVVGSTLSELLDGERPTILVFNKIDRLTDADAVGEMRMKYPQAVFISAARGMGLHTLTDQLSALVQEEYSERDITLPAGDGRRAALLHEVATVTDRRYVDESLLLHIRFPASAKAKIEGILATKR